MKSKWKEITEQTLYSLYDDFHKYEFYWQFGDVRDRLVFGYDRLFYRGIA